MPYEIDKFAAARKASGITIEKAALTCDMSKPCYCSREKDPQQFRLVELKKLYAIMSDTAKPILRDAICDLFLP